MHVRSTRRDPTPFLVLGLVVVITLLFATRLLVGGEPATTSAEDGSATATAPPTVDTSGLGPRPDEATPAPSDEPARTGPKGRKGTSGTTRPGGTKGPGRAKPAGPPPLATDEQRGRQCVETGLSGDVSVLSYNIKSGQGPGTLPQIAQVLRGSSADIVLLQEVDQLRYSSGRVDMPAYFSEQLDMAFAFGKNVYHPGGGSYGTAILSRHPILSVDNTYLPRPGATQQRGLLHAVVDVGGIEVSVYNTHLQNADEPARMLQVAAINRLTATDTRPRILGGDLNASPSSRPMAVLGSRWTDTWDVVGSGLGQTAPAGNPRARIDYLLHSGSGITPLATDVLTTFASDHRPVRAAYRLEVPGEPICFPDLG